MKRALTLSLAFSLIALTTSSLTAAVLVNWNFDGAAPGVAGTIVDTTSSVASVADVSSVGATGSRQISGTTTNLPAGGGTGTGLDYIAPYEAGTAGPPAASFYGVNGFSTSPVSTSYISFSLTMATTIDPTVSQLEGIQFNLANAGTSGPRGVEVTYRIGTSGSFTSLGTTAVPNNTANNYGLFTFNLSTPAALSSGDVVEFRLLGYSNSVSNSIRLDDVSITAIPEPSAFALIVAAGALLIMLRRRTSSP